MIFHVNCKYVSALTNHKSMLPQEYLEKLVGVVIKKDTACHPALQKKKSMWAKN